MSTVDDFIELSNIALSNEPIKESIKTVHLLEMSKLTARETGLPVDIWIDEGRTFTKSGHGKRIKFQGDKSKNSNNWVSLTVSNNPEVPKGINHNLSSHEINKIKLFVINNLDILNQLGNPDFGITEFIKNMKTNSEDL